MKKFVSMILLGSAILTAGTIHGVSAATSAITPASALKQAVQSGERSSYVATGTTSVLYHGKRVVSGIKMYHQKPDCSRIEYLTPPLKGLVSGEDGRCAWRYDPRTGKAVVSDCIRKGSSQLDLLVHSHGVKISGAERLAGRSSLVLTIASKSGEIRKRLWIDKSTFVTLRSEDYDNDGHVQSSTLFKTIEYVGSLPKSLFGCPKRDRTKVCCISNQALSLPQVSKAVGFQVSKPKYIPSGYRLDGYRVYNCPSGCGHKAAYTRYTNGMESISIFETGADVHGCGCCRQKQNGGRSCCVMNCEGGKQASISIKGRTVVVIGNITRAEAERIARSFK